MPTGGNDNVVREIGRNAKSASDEDFDVDGDLKDGEKRAGDGVKVGGGSTLGEVEVASKQLQSVCELKIVLDHDSWHEVE